MTLSRDHSNSSIWEASGRREFRPEVSWCEHDDPILVITTETGYCARCPICQGVGPERQSFKEARIALLGATPRY